MNNWTPLETQLRSWTPRNPSPHLADQLFTSPEAVPQGNLALWFGPAFASAAALILLAACLLSRFGPSTQADGFPSLVHLVFAGAHASNSMQAALWELPSQLLVGDANLSKNLCAKASFEWTNTSRSVLPIRSFPSVQTNRIML